MPTSPVPRRKPRRALRLTAYAALTGLILSAGVASTSAAAISDGPGASAAELKGVQVPTQAQSPAAEIGVDENGRAVVFSVATGSTSKPPELVVTDVLTQQVVDHFPVPGAAGSWTIRQDPSTKKVFIGTYPSRNIATWTPGDTSVKVLGQVPGPATTVYSIDHGRDGRIYGGSSGEGSSGARMWTWSAADGMKAFGPVLGTDTTYARAVAHEDRSRTVWGGTDQKAHLWGCTEAAQCTDFTSLLGAKTRQYSGVYNMVANDGYVMAWGGDHGSAGNDEVTILKPSVSNGKVTATRVAVIDGVVYAGSSDVQDGKIYYVKAETGQPMYSYDLASGTETKLGEQQGIASRRWGIAELNDAAWPGATVVGWNVGGYLYRRNIETDVSDRALVTGQPEMFTNINALATGPDGKIYSNGYLTGGVGVFNPEDDAHAAYALSGQAESMTTHAGRIYQGVYSSATVSSFAPADLGAAGKRTDCSIGNNQERPYGLVGKGDRVYFGSRGKPGAATSGAFGWADVDAPDAGVDKACTVVSGLGAFSVNRLTTSGSKVFGGTSIYVSWNATTATESEAKLMVYDEATSKLQLIKLPQAGLASIDAVVAGDDGIVWVYARGWLFAFDPSTNTFVLQEKLWSGPTGNIGGHRADLVYRAENDTLYLRDGNKIYSIDPGRARAGGAGQATRLLHTGADKALVLDGNGRLYTIQGDNLKQIVVGGCAVVGYPSKAPSTTGWYAGISQKVTVTDPANATLAFRMKREAATLTGYHRVQVLVDGKVIDDKDITAFAQATWVTRRLNLTGLTAGQHTVTIRMYEAKPVTSYAAKLYVDTVGGTGLTVTNGLFADNLNGWTPVKNGSNWTTEYQPAHECQ